MGASGDSRAEVSVFGEDEAFRALVSASLATDGHEIGRPIVVVRLDDPRRAHDVERAHAAHPDAGIVVCVPRSAARHVRKAFDAGADGVVWDSELGERLTATISAVASGQIVLPREAWRLIEPPRLTTREKQVLGLVIMGLSNGEIAQKLYLSESTVKSHLSSSFAKLGVRSRAEASRVITDPSEGLGTGILAITPTSSSGPRPQPQPD